MLKNKNTGDTDRLKRSVSPVSVYDINFSLPSSSMLEGIRNLRWRAVQAF
jgi:hypothetical protein